MTNTVRSSRNAQRFEHHIRDKKGRSAVNTLQFSYKPSELDCLSASSAESAQISQLCCIVAILMLIMIGAVLYGLWRQGLTWPFGARLLVTASKEKSSRIRKKNDRCKQSHQRVEIQIWDKPAQDRGRIPSLRRPNRQHDNEHLRQTNRQIPTTNQNRLTARTLHQTHASIPTGTHEAMDARQSQRIMCTNIISNLTTNTLPDKKKCEQSLTM